MVALSHLQSTIRRVLRLEEYGRQAERGWRVRAERTRRDPSTVPTKRRDGDEPFSSRHMEEMWEEESIWIEESTGKVRVSERAGRYERIRDRIDFILSDLSDCLVDSVYNFMNFYLASLMRWRKEGNRTSRVWMVSLAGWTFLISSWQESILFTPSQQKTRLHPFRYDQTTVPSWNGRSLDYHIFLFFDLMSSLPTWLRADIFARINMSLELHFPHVFSIPLLCLTLLLNWETSRKSG